MDKEKFLENRHYNIYKDKPITYKKFICKDCTQNKKEYEYYNQDEEDPVNINNLGYIEVFSGKYPIYVTTPTMVCPFGFNRENNQLIEAESILSEWVSRNPSDGNAKKILEEVRSGG